MLTISTGLHQHLHMDGVCAVSIGSLSMNILGHRTLYFRIIHLEQIVFGAIGCGSVDLCVQVLA